MSTRRRRGEDGISFEHRGPCRDPHRHRHCPGLWRGELTLGTPATGSASAGRSAARPRPPSWTSSATCTPRSTRHHPRARLRPLHAPASRRELARPRAGRPLGQNSHQEPECSRADPGRHRRPETPRPDRRRRPPGAGRDGRRVLHRGCEHGPPRAQARHPARRSQRPRQPQRRHLADTPKASMAGPPNPSPWTRLWRS
jgi:hypothetical protein